MICSHWVQTMVLWLPRDVHWILNFHFIVINNFHYSPNRWKWWWIIWNHLWNKKREIWSQFFCHFMSVLCCYNAEGEGRGLEKVLTFMVEHPFQESSYPLGLSRGLLPGGLGEGRRRGAGGGGRNGVGVCSPLHKTFNWFMTKIWNFPTLSRAHDNLWPEK